MNKTQHLSHYLDWSHLEAPGILRMKTGGLLRTLTFRGHDREAVDHGDKSYAVRRLNRALSELSDGWCAHIEMRRDVSTDYMRARHGSEASRLVDVMRSREFERAGRSYRTSYYITLSHRAVDPAPSRVIERLADLVGGLFVGGIERALREEREGLDESLEEFDRATRAFADSLKDFFATAHWLDSSELLTYLKSTISTHPQHVSEPTVPLYVDTLLTEQRAQFGLEATLGDHALYVISIKGYPRFTHPDLLHALETINGSFRLVSRALFTDDEPMRIKLRGRRNVLLTTGNREEADQVEELEREVKVEANAIVFHSLMIVVTEADRLRAVELVERIEALFKKLGFVPVREHYGLFASWLASLPGNRYANPRRAMIRSRNLAHMIPMYATWTGDERATHTSALGRDEPPHLMCQGTPSQPEPFGLNLNTKDVGHTLVIGRTGSGKSALLSSLALAWSKYEGARVFILDKDRSSRAATLASNGTFLDLDPTDAQTSFAPFARIHEPREASFAADWLASLCAMSDPELTIGTSERRLIRSAIDDLATMAPEHRRLATLAITIQHKRMRRALEEFASTERGGGAGAWSALFDHSEESFGIGDWTALEMSALFGAPEHVRALTISYLFHRLESYFADGRPTLLIMDEAWLFLSHPRFVDQIKSWLKTLRKFNVFCIFATQEPSDILDSPIKHTLLDACDTRIVLPNQKASEPEFRSIYERLSLSSQAIEQLARATPQSDYLYMSMRGTRLFSLRITNPIELALVAASSPRDQQRIDAASARAERERISFLEAYLIERRLDPRTYLERNR